MNPVAQSIIRKIFSMIFQVFEWVAMFLSSRWVINQLDSTSRSEKNERLRVKEQLKRLVDQSGLKINIKNLTDYELRIAAKLKGPDDISVSWKNIAGLDSVLQELRESVVLPIQHTELFTSTLWSAPRGVLLHGPPGCGKTLIAKATAKEVGTRLLNLDVAMLTDKSYGESQNLASAVFTLAAKFQPCIIFIDEIDSFLRSRNSTDHEATAIMKTQFMMFWDGLNTEQDSKVIVMGATNRPQDLDEAILSRMPARYYIGLPNEEQRIQILVLILENENISDNLDFSILAKETDGLSGSDLKELCRNASVYRKNQYIKADDEMLAITQDDILKSIRKMKDSKIGTTNSVSARLIDLGIE